MERVGVFFLHGFLGRPEDWDATRRYLDLPSGISSYAVDYFGSEDLTPELSFEDWAQAFNELVQSKKNDVNILVGYSLGGRLGLHALKSDPNLWSQVLCVSTNPGFDDVADGLDPEIPLRAKRWLNDSYWADQFRNGSWQDVLKAWNAQPIFGESSAEPTRIEEAYSRELLGLALTNWSLAQQKNMRSLLQEEVAKITWVVGAEDEKFFDLACELQEKIKGLSVFPIPSASHRVLFDKPRELATLIRPLIK